MVSEKACLFSTLSLNSLRLLVRLGCSEQERKIPQFVRFDVRLRLSELPRGCFSDQLEESICYDHLSQVIAEICNRQEYALIEKLGYDAFKALRETVSPQTQLWLLTTKEAPPVQGLEGGASFSIGDWPEHEFIQNTRV